MAEYKSRFPELGFYVGGVQKQFRGGAYRTNDPAEQAVLDALPDVQKIASAPAKPAAQTEVREPRKPAPKKPSAK